MAKQSLSASLAALEKVAVGSTFDSLSALAIQYTKPALLKARLPSVLSYVRDKLKGLQQPTGRVIFKGCAKFPADIRGLKRIDAVVQEFDLNPPDHDNMITALHAASLGQSDIDGLLQEVEGDWFAKCRIAHLIRFGIDECFRKHAANIRQSRGSASATILYFAEQVVARVAMVRFDAMTIAVAELLNALRTGEVKAFAAGSDGNEQFIEPEFWCSEDGWRVLVEGAVAIPRKYCYLPGAPRQSVAGIYIADIDPKKRIRGGRNALAQTEASAVEWLIAEIDRPGSKPRKREILLDEMRPLFKLSDRDLDRVRAQAFKIAERGPEWSKPGPKSESSAANLSAI